MKKVLIFCLFALVTMQLKAQFVDYKGWENHEIEIIGGLGGCTGEENHYWHESKAIPTGNISYTFRFNNYFGLGAGVMYDRFKVRPHLVGGIVNVYKSDAFSFYGSIRGYIPSYCKYITFVGVFDIGRTVSNLSDEAEIVPESFMYSPQLGIRIKFAKDKKIALNLRAFYKDVSKFDAHIWGALLGVSF